MSHGPANPFEPLDPPSGGLAALRARLERERGRSRRLRRRWVLAAASAVAVALATFFLLAGSWMRDPSPESFRLARLMAGIESPPTEPLTIPASDRRRTAAQRVPAASDDIVFYLVASVETPLPEK